MDGHRLRVSHIVLDVDGTLVDFDTAIRSALEATAARCSELTGSVVTPRALQQARNLVAAEPAWRRRPLAEARVESLRRVLAAAGDAVADRHAAVDELAELLFRTRNETMAVYPDVRDALEALRAADLTLIAASNGNADLAVPGIDHYFHATLFAKDAEHLKPDPRFFSQALRRGGGAAERALAVGDRLENDYRPARAAGLHAVLIDRAGAVSDPAVRRIAALTELAALVERPV